MGVLSNGWKDLSNNHHANLFLLLLHNSEAWKGPSNNLYFSAWISIFSCIKKKKKGKVYPALRFSLCCNFFQFWYVYSLYHYHCTYFYVLRGCQAFSILFNLLLIAFCIKLRTLNEVSYKPAPWHASPGHSLDIVCWYNNVSFCLAWCASLPSLYSIMSGQSHYGLNSKNRIE